MERILPLLSGAHLTGHCTQFLKRENSDPQAAQAEAVVFSWLRAEKVEPRLFEDAGTGGPDFCCAYSGSDRFLLEVTSKELHSILRLWSLNFAGIEVGAMTRVIALGTMLKQTFASVGSARLAAMLR